MGTRPFLQLADAQTTGLVRQRRPPEIAARWRCRPQMKNLTAHYISQLSLLFSLGSQKTPINGSKLVLSLSLLFSNFCCFDFLY